MLRSVIALLAICALPGIGVADQRLTPEEIVDFFTRDAAEAQAQEQTRTRGLTIGEPGTAADRSVFVGPAGFGDETRKAVGNGSGDQSAPPPAGLDLLINFDLDSARLTDAARQNLDAFVQALHHPALSGLRFAVEGHTDATGPDAYNLSLSRRRAAAVVDYLAARGVDTDRLAAQGYGESRPRTADPEDPQNRRVETRRLP